MERETTGGNWEPIGKVAGRVIEELRRLMADTRSVPVKVGPRGGLGDREGMPPLNSRAAAPEGDQGAGLRKKVR
jgi:hypothetical protein